MTSQYNQAMVSDAIFAQLTRDKKLNELATFVLESGVQPLQKDLELFEKRLDMYAGLMEIDIESARHIVIYKCRELLNTKLKAYNIK